MATVREQNGYIRVYNSVSGEWEYIRPESTAEQIKYSEQSSQNLKEVVDSKLNSADESTDNSVVRFDGESGEYVKDSKVIIDDNGSISTPGYITANGKVTTKGINIKPNSSSSNIVSIGTATLSGSQTVTLPNDSGTVALTKNIGDATITIQKNGSNVDSFTTNTNTNKTINIPDVASASTLSSHMSNTSNPHSVTKSQVGLGNVTNDSQVKRSEMGIANGVATLDTNGKVYLSQIPDSVLGNVLLGGTVAKSTQAGSDELILSLSLAAKERLAFKIGATIPDTVAVTNTADNIISQGVLLALGYRDSEGLYFIASETFDIVINGVTVKFEVGDWLISIGTSWGKIDNTDAVVSVNGKYGEVTLYGSDIAMSSSDSTKLNTAINSKQQKVSAMGSTTKPVYVSGNGVFSEASTYAGGTKVTLNGSDKGASTASIYSPTSSGTAGQFLKSKGANQEPEWVDSPNTWRAVKVDDNDFLDSSTAKTLNLISGDGVTITGTPGNGRAVFKLNSSNTTTIGGVKVLNVNPVIRKDEADNMYEIIEEKDI